MSRFKLIVVVVLLSSCCKDTEIIKQLDSSKLTFSLYSSLYRENTTVHKNENKLKRVIFNNSSYYDNAEYFSNDSLQSVWSVGALDSYTFKYKNVKIKDTLVFTSVSDTILYLFENNMLKKIKMSYNNELYIITSYNNTDLEMTLVAGINQTKQADYKVIFDTASYQDFYPQSYYAYLPPLNYLRYYTEFYNLNFPKLSYKSISIKSYTSTIATDDINIRNEFDILKRIKKSYIIRSKYPVRNDTLSYSYFD